MIYVAATALFLWLLWGVYVLVMGVYRAHLNKRLTRITYALGLPWVVIGYVMDVIANLFIASVIFLELPREWLVTTRLKRHIDSGIGTWRGHLAGWVCDHLLDVFDPREDHC